MPMTYRIDPIKRIVFSSGSGIVTDADLITQQSQLRVDPSFDRSFRLVFDLSAVEGFALQEEIIRYLASVQLFRSGVPRAIVIREDMLTLLARMGEPWAQAGGERAHMFHDMDAALAWLERSSEPTEQNEREAPT